MSCYIAIHQLVDTAEQDTVRSMRKQLYACVHGTDLKWVDSWYIPAKNQLICQWDAPEAQSVRQTLADCGVLSIAPLVLLEEAVPAGPTAFQGEFEVASSDAPS